MRIVEWLIEAFFTIKLFLSPALIGGLIGAYVYLTANSETQVYVAYGIWALGVLSGILLAWKVKKKKAATEFFGQIISTPDLDGRKKNP
jgi:hypothetical protein